MTTVSAITLYIIVWWTVLFAVLPFGAQPDSEVLPGNAPSAPADPRLKDKAIWTTMIAGCVWMVLVSVIEADLVSFREWSKQFGVY
jgi:predicted secreted protein